MKRDRKALKAATQTLVMLLLASPVLTWAAGPVAPGAGTLLQQIEPLAPPAPTPSGTGLRIEPGGTAKLPPSAPFLVKAIQITGNAKFDTGVLHALVIDGEGQSLSLAQLNELAARITDYYRHHGYPLARAIIPAQTIQDGRVAIEVIEARYGKISLDNHSRVNTALLNATLSPVHSGLAIEQAVLDRSLLLLSDIPAVLPSATLKPGEAVGTSDLNVDATAGPAVTANVSLDNFGNAYTGRAQAGGAVYFINPLHHGDVLTVNGLSTGSGMTYGRVGYESLLNGQGTRVGASVLALQYVLGEPLALLDGHGTAGVVSFWLRHPFVRTPDVNLYGQFQYEVKQLRDHIDASSIRADRHLEYWIASLSGDARDAILSGGINTWSVGLTAGCVGFDDATAQAVDAATARVQGGFIKWNATLSRLQRLNANDGLYAAFSGQWANTNLDPSEKMVAGGRYTVRAFDTSAVSGDTGVQASIELRHDLALGWHGHWQAVAFFDGEHVKVNKNVWTAGANDATLEGAGLGLNWTGSDQWSAKLYVATRIGSTPVLVKSSTPTRAWWEIGKAF